MSVSNDRAKKGRLVCNVVARWKVPSVELRRGQEDENGYSSCLRVDRWPLLQSRGCHRAGKLAQAAMQRYARLADTLVSRAGIRRDGWACATRLRCRRSRLRMGCRRIVETGETGPARVNVVAAGNQAGSDPARNVVFLTSSLRVLESRLWSHASSGQI